MILTADLTNSLGLIVCISYKKKQNPKYKVLFLLKLYGSITQLIAQAICLIG